MPSVLLQVFYLRLQLDTQLLQLLVMFLLQLLQSHFSLDADSRSRNVVQGADGCRAKRSQSAIVSVYMYMQFLNDHQKVLLAEWV